MVTLSGGSRCRRAGILSAAALTRGFGSRLLCCQTERGLDEDWSKDWRWQR